VSPPDRLNCATLGVNAEYKHLLDCWKDLRGNPRSAVTADGWLHCMRNRRGFAGRIRVSDTSQIDPFYCRASRGH